jgi:hypothetical protein
MILTNRPQNAGTAQDAYEVLEGVFGGADFTQAEAATAISQSLDISEGQASGIVSSLVSGECIAN